MKNFTLAEAYVTDTVGLILYLEKRRFGKRAERVFEAAARSETCVRIPAMVMAEILYLQQCRRTSAGLADVGRLLSEPNGFDESPMDFGVIAAANEIFGIPDLHDRLIAATARSLDIPLITNDTAIEESGAVRTIW